MTVPALHVLIALARLLLVAYLPGALLYRVPLVNRARREALPAEERAFWAVILSVTISLVATLLLAVAGQYSFGRLLLADSVIAVATLAVFRRRLLYRGGARAIDRGAVPPMALIALGVWMFFPPAEYVMGGKDPGVYLNEGIQIAQRGSLVVRDPVIGSVPARFRDMFYPQHERQPYYGLRFMGFYILDPAQGTVVGQFPHLYPASIAIGYGIDGLTGARRTSGFWAILGLVTVYVSGSRLFGRRVAFAGALLLAVNVIQIWYARYPNSEIVMQALGLAALLAAARAFVDGETWLAPIAAVLLSLLLALRYEILLALAAVSAMAALRFSGHRTAVISFGLTLAACLPLSWLYLTRLMAPYAQYPVAYTRSFGFVWLAVAGVAGLAIMRVVARRPTWARLLQYGLAGTVLVLAAYAYFVRQTAGRVAVHDAAAFRMFGWYITRAGLFAAVVGFVLAVRDRFWRDPALFLATFIYGAFFFWKIRIVPEHFWMTRRFLPVVLPIALLCIAYAAFRVADAVAAWWTSRSGNRASPYEKLLAPLAACALLAPLAAELYRASAPVRAHVEYAGLIPRLETLAKTFGDDELVVVESRNASDTHVLALPLAYIYARNVLVLNNPRPDKALFREFLTWAGSRYKNVYFVGGGGTDLLSRSISVASVRSEHFQVPEYASPRNAYPTGVRMKEFDFGIYRFVPGRDDGAWYSLDVGLRDDLHLVRFHAKEQTGQVSFRWTRRLSYVSLVGLRPDTRTLTLWMNDGGRPPSVPPAHIRVYLDDEFTGETDVGRGFQPYSFMIPSEVARTAGARDEPVLMRIESTLWNPRAALGVPDNRDVGVMVDRVEAR